MVMWSCYWTGLSSMALSVVGHWVWFKMLETSDTCWKWGSVEGRAVNIQSRVRAEAAAADRVFKGSSSEMAPGSSELRERLHWVSSAGKVPGWEHSQWTCPEELCLPCWQENRKPNRHVRWWWTRMQPRTSKRWWGYSTWWSSQAGVCVRCSFTLACSMCVFVCVTGNRYEIHTATFYGLLHSLTLYSCKTPDSHCPWPHTLKMCNAQKVKLLALSISGYVLNKQADFNHTCTCDTEKGQQVALHHFISLEEPENFLFELASFAQTF